MTKAEAKPANGNGANLGFEASLWKAADALRSNMDVVFGDAGEVNNPLPEPGHRNGGSDRGIDRTGEGHA